MNGFLVFCAKPAEGFVFKFICLVLGVDKSNDNDPAYTVLFVHFKTSLGQCSGETCKHRHVKDLFEACGCVCRVCGWQGGCPSDEVMDGDRRRRAISVGEICGGASRIHFGQPAKHITTIDRCTCGPSVALFGLYKWCIHGVVQVESSKPKFMHLRFDLMCHLNVLCRNLYVDVRAWGIWSIRM